MNGSTYCLKHLTDNQLLESLARLCVRGNELTAELLGHLIEVDRRRLYAQEGYSSLYEYCVRHLGHTEDEAGRRIHAARAAGRFPVLLPMLARGELHLSTINLISTHLTDAVTAQELIAAAKGKTKRKVEQMLASRFPKPDARTRLVPLGGAGPAAATSATARAPLPLFASAKPAPTSPTATPRAADTAAAISSGVPAAKHAAAAVASSPPTPVEPARDARFRLQVTISLEAHDNLLLAQALLAHSVPSGDLGVVIERAVELLCDDLHAKKFAKLKRPAKPETTRATEATVAPAAAISDDPCRADQQGVAYVPGRINDHSKPQHARDDAAGEAACVGAPLQASPREATESAAVPNDAAALPANKGDGSTRQRSRHIPRAVRRAVAERDGQRCTYVSPAGIRCNQTRRLEFNHITPYACGGEATVDGINLLCKTHNDLKARLDFGEAHMAAAKTRGRSRGRGVAPPKP